MQHVLRDAEVLARPRDVEERPALQDPHAGEAAVEVVQAGVHRDAGGQARLRRGLRREIAGEAGGFNDPWQRRFRNLQDVLHEEAAVSSFLRMIEPAPGPRIRHVIAGQLLAQKILGLADLPELPEGPGGVQDARDREGDELRVRHPDLREKRLRRKA